MSDPTGPSSSQVGCNPPLIEGNRRTSLSSVKAFLSGGFGGICLVLIGHPWTSSRCACRLRYPGSLTAYWTAGVASSVQVGYGVSTVGCSPAFGGGTYDGHFFLGLPRLAEPLSVPLGPGPLPTTVAGGLSAFPTVLLATPGERVKCLMQVSGNRQPKPTMVEVARQVLHSEAFEASIRPPDVLKSRIQTCPNDLGISQAYRDLIKSEGWGGLYRGLGPAMLRAFPANAACFYGKSTVFSGQVTFH
ncbi:hypothetical protein L0F63_005503 [Massospora cicadina]|nr:hypothetical protein L0F63_005503 [Massospora cicadina]